MLLEILDGGNDVLQPLEFALSELFLVFSEDSSGFEMGRTFVIAGLRSVEVAIFGQGAFLKSAIDIL